MVLIWISIDILIATLSQFEKMAAVRHVSEGKFKGCIFILEDEKEVCWTIHFFSRSKAYIDEKWSMKIFLTFCISTVHS